MNDKCLLENILTLTKSLATLYINAAIESANTKVNEVMENGLARSLELQQSLYLMMSEDGYYQITNVNAPAIKKVLTKINKDESE